MANEAPPAIQYRDLMAECQQLMTKVADLESDRNEHILVEDTLKPLDGGRRAYRLVGDVLVERTVAEVLPSITQNKNNVRMTTWVFERANIFLFVFETVTYFYEFQDLFPHI